MRSLWILVANASSAQLYEGNGSGKDLVKIREFQHSASREKGSDLVSDRPGHFKSAGTGHGAFVPPTDPKENEAVHFAQELARELEQGRTSNAYKRLILICPPRFMGLLNGCVSTHVRDLVVERIEKDYTKISNIRELTQHIENRV